MIEKPKFLPIYPSHAIERCATSFIFDQALPQKVFDRTVESARPRLAKLRFAPAPNQGISIDVDANTGAFSVKAGGGPVVFMSVEGGPQLTLAPNQIIYQTTKYVRWRPFMGEFERTAKELILSYLDALSVSHIKVEYWDRFGWTGTWADFDPWLLLRKDANFVSAAATTHGSLWHSHCGWFEMLSGGAKRLTNVNIDTIEIMLPESPPQPSVGIYTLMQDEVGALLLDLPKALDKLDVLHMELKKLLAAVISPEAARQVQLNAGSA